MSDTDYPVDLGANVPEQVTPDPAAVEDDAIESPVTDVGTEVESPVPAPLPDGVVLR